MTNPLGRIKDLTIGAIKAPVVVAGHATRTATGLTVRAADRLIPDAKVPTQEQPAEEQPTGDLPTPVNVTEELGLDPAPVAERPADEPLTSIDAAADPDAVDVTPADIVDQVARKRPSARAAVPRTPDPADVPGDKLPRR